ncbi:MAG: hypothetical protein RI897_4144 [Verrucomicrobiota bacterium]
MEPRRISFYAWGVLVCFCGGVVIGEDGLLAGWEVLGRLDRMAEYRPVEEVGCISSYDRSGGNDDGFSGRYSFVRKEEGALVLADLEGPGVIYRIWTPTPTDDWMEFYFDGEVEPRIRVKFRELFLGGERPFVRPLVGYGVGGFFSYVPLAYERSCKVVLRGERVQFYQINYARYGGGSGIRSYEAGRDGAKSVRVSGILGMAGRDLSQYTSPPGERVEVVRSRVVVPSGGSGVLYESNRGGRIVGFRLKGLGAIFRRDRGVVLRVSYDGDEPSVLCPVSDFFGGAWGEPAMQSLLVGGDEREAYCYFPMPYDAGVKVELVSEGDGVEVEVEVMVVGVARREGEGRFGVVWRRENPTGVGEPFTFMRGRGRGHVVGCVLQAQGLESGKTLYFEGDDVTVLDGVQAVHGTGSEDFFNGGWYDVPDRWEKRLSFGLSGCLGYWKHLGRTGGYRFLLGDAYSFEESVLQTIEHAGEGNSIQTDYVGVTYFYSEEPMAEVLPEVGGRGVVDLAELVFPAWWQIPVLAFPFEGSELTRLATRLGDKQVKYLSMRGGAEDWVGPPYLYLGCHVPRGGVYRVAADVLCGPEGGRLQLFQDEVPVAGEVDLYAAEAVERVGVVLGELRLGEGVNPVMLKLVGRCEEAKALGLDLIQLRLSYLRE